MPKKIKFNLICDGVPIRNKRELQEHFNASDLLDYFFAGILHRWLEVRDEKEAYEKVFELYSSFSESGNDKDIERKVILKLLEIFNVQPDEQAIYDCLYIRERQRESEKNKTDFSIDSQVEFLRSQTDRYKEISERLLEADLKYIAGITKEISNMYYPFFELNYSNIILKCARNNKADNLAVILFDERLRKCVIPENLDDNEYVEDVDDYQYVDSKDNEYYMKKIIKECFASVPRGRDSIAGRKVQRQEGKTVDGKMVTLSARECIIISASTSILLEDKNGNRFKGDNCPIFMDGIRYCSQNEKNKLYYIEK